MTIIVSSKIAFEQGDWEKFCRIVGLNPLSDPDTTTDFELTLEQAVDCGILPQHHIDDFYSKLLELRGLNHG